MTILLWAALAWADDDAEFLRWQGRIDPLPLPAEQPASEYRFTWDLFGQIAEKVKQKPGVVDTEQIGTTLEGKPIWAFHIEDPARPPERSVLVFAGIHALEWISTEVATDLLIYLVDHPVPNVRITVIPLLNPDGRRKVEEDLSNGVDAYRRGNSKNVDLNRDFAVNTDAKAIWKYLLPSRYAHSETPLSQPESQALDQLAARELYDRAASLHAFGGFLYYPWSGHYSTPPDRQDFVQLGLAMEQAQGPRAYRTRQLARWGFFFRAHGTELDHLYGKYGTRSFLVEMTRSGLNFSRPSEWKWNFRLYNPKDPEVHIERGFRAMRALILEPPTPGELEHPAGTQRFIHGVDYSRGVE